MQLGHAFKSLSPPARREPSSIFSCWAATSSCTIAYQKHRFSVVIWDRLLRCFICKIFVFIHHMEHRLCSQRGTWLLAVLAAALGGWLTHLRGHSSCFSSPTPLGVPVMMLSSPIRLEMCPLCVFIQLFVSCPGRQVWAQNWICLLAAELQQNSHRGNN